MKGRRCAGLANPAPIKRSGAARRSKAKPNQQVLLCTVYTTQETLRGVT